MSGPSGERCSSCYFCAAGRSGMVQGEMDKCHRFPTVVTVVYNHWCGEWAPKKSENAPGAEPA